MDNEPRVPDEDDTLGFMDQHSVSRRDLWKALSLGGLAALASGGSTGQVSGQSLGDEPIIELGEDWEVDVDNSTMRFTHVPSGNVWILNDDGAAENFGGIATTNIDDTDSPYVTQDEDIIYVDDSTAAVTVTLATADATVGNEIEMVLLDGSNGATVNTEGSETIDPNGESSKSISKPGWEHAFTWNDTAWETSELLQEPVAFPDSATPDADRQTIIGHDASVVSDNIDDSFDKSATVIGHNAIARNPNNSFPNHGRVVIGTSADARQDEGVVIGSEATTGQKSVSIGAGAINTGTDSVLIGARTSLNQNRGVVIGQNASGRGNAVAVGWDATGHDGVSVGRRAGVTTSHFTPHVAIGTNAIGGRFGVAVGANAKARNDGSIAIGESVEVDTDNVARVGGTQLVFGGVMDTIADADLNPSEVTFDIDETNNELIARVKYSDGTIKTGQTPLS